GSAPRVPGRRVAHVQPLVSYGSARPGFRPADNTGSRMIEIRNLTKRYGDFTAVDDISLTVSPGEIYGFLGPNGAGKTTTIRLLAGLSLPTSGSLRIAGIDLGSDGTAIKSILGYVPDRPYLYEKLTGAELLQFVVNLYGREWRDCEARATELLRYLDIDAWTNARVESYSHGMKQKLVNVAALDQHTQGLV